MISLIIILCSIVLDQFTKFLATGLNGKEPIVIVNNFLEITYLENRGAAFGILQEKKLLLSFFTIVIIGIITYYLYKNYSSSSIWVKIAFSLIIGGAIGNLIDRMRQSFVVDFISVIFPNGYRFPVFNVADISVVVGSSLLIILIIFFKDIEV